MIDKQLTHCGEPAAEESMRFFVNKITQGLTSELSHYDLRALVLLGGYGKGEGGVIVIGRRCRPHNNIDLMLVVGDQERGSIAILQERVNRKAEYLERKLEIGIDISVITESKLRSMPTRVLWYDMKEGHRTLYGDDSLVPSIPHDKRDIPSWDMRNLMVNRGSLLLISYLCFNRLNTRNQTHFKNKNTAIRRLIIKHTMKAIIGYGDALLYFGGTYHWSYKEKQQRIVSCLGASSRFKEMYSLAIRFRFSPDYSRYDDCNLETWHTEVSEVLSQVHLKCESVRLQRADLDWGHYLETALSSLSVEQGLNVKSIGRCGLNVLSNHPGKLGSTSSVKTAMGYYTSNSQTLIPLLMPLIAYAYPGGDLDYKDNDFLCSHFGLKHFEYERVVCQYLKSWGQNFDQNLWSVLKKHDLQL